MGFASKSQKRSPSSRHWLSLKPAAQHFLEHLALEGADRPIGLGKLVIRAGMLAQESGSPRAASRGHFGLDAPVNEQAGELNQPPFPLVPLTWRDTGRPSARSPG